MAPSPPRRLAAALLATSLLLSACGGSDDGSETARAEPTSTTDQRAAGTSSERPEDTSTATESGSTESEAGRGRERGRGEIDPAKQARVDKLRAFYARWRDARDQHAQNVANRPPPPPPAPAAGPPPPPAAPPVTADPMIARRASFAQMCAVATEMDIRSILNGSALDDLSDLPDLLLPMVEFFRRSRSMAPAELADEMAIIDPVAEELITLIDDFAALGIGVDDERWLNGVLTVAQDDSDFLGAVASVLALLNQFCT